MRLEDLERLDYQYALGGNLDFQFEEALGIAIPEIRSLHQEIAGDFDPVRFGVGWWSPHPGTKRRILISDHLLICTNSVQRNATEAKLHLLELIDLWRERSSFYSESLESRGVLPPRVRARDDLPMRLASAHAAGFFRAIVGALDCLGATIVGVAALPTKILTADLVKARIAFQSKKLSGSGGIIQDELSAHLESAIGRVGPAGWLKWTTDFRNMLVHRARRMEMLQAERKESPILDAAGRSIVRAETTIQLPRDPGRSEIEVMLHRANALVLTEAAQDTLEGVMASTLGLIADVTGALIDVWRRRRASPDILSQPKEQWPDGPSPETTGFEGYRPGSVVYEPRALVGHPILATRIRAAALDDAQRGKWNRFD